MKKIVEKLAGILAPVPFWSYILVTILYLSAAILVFWALFMGEE